MEPVSGERTGGPVADYGALRELPPSAARIRQLGGLIASLLRDSGTDAAVRDGNPPTVVFWHDGGAVVLGLAWEAEAGDEFERAVRQSAPDASIILLSIGGFAGQVAGETDAGSGAPIRWDRTHMEALVCGLITVQDLFEASRRTSLFNSIPYPSLPQLLAGPDDPPPARMMTPDLLPPPWPFPGAGYVGTPAELVLAGEDGWDKPTGIAVIGDRQLVAVTASGLIELDAARGMTSWILPLPGCVNKPLVLADGSMLAVCNTAVVRISNGELEAVAGGFDGNVHLLAGPDGEPWALSGYGSSSTGECTLALTRLGARAGDQHRYDIDFPVQIFTAGWLDGLRFFLAGSSVSAVVDLGRGTRITRADWIESSHSYEQKLVVTSPHSVVTAAGSPKGIGVTLFSTDTRARGSMFLGELELNAVDGLCAAPDGTGYLLGDVRAGRRGPYDPAPWPVLVRLPGLFTSAIPSVQPNEPAETTFTLPGVTADTGTTVRTSEASGMTDPYDPVRRAAQGRRKDYKLATRPIDSGGQAEVFSAQHKPTGIDVAFKRAKSSAPRARARMRREIEAAQLFGGNPHVMPVLDNSDVYEWFVMPLAGDTAGTFRLQFAEDANLRELVTAVCAALRPAHEIGWIHRDLKPSNLLQLDGRWTVADWGLTRRPRGQTTDPDRTRAGAPFGTDGWAAPELSADAHAAGPQADIYSIGQIIGWAVTGQRPRVNIPLIPDNGPWREVVTAATYLDPARRPSSVDDLQLVIARELGGSPSARNVENTPEKPGGEAPLAELLTRPRSADPVAFARVITVLLSWDHPTIRHVDSNGPDRGRDAEFSDENGLHVFEAKSFSGPMNSSRKRQVERTLASAAKTARLASWTLVTPIEPTPADLEWFHRLSAQYPFALRWLGLSWIEDRLAQHPEIRPHFQGSIGN
jgi:serine/threonine protein kinase